MELPDWLRALVLLGKDGDEYRVLGVDADGYLGAILKAAAEVTIPGDVSVDQNDSTRAVQGTDGGALRTIAVDANGQIIMVPRGQGGNYLAVDADGYLAALMRGHEAGVGQHNVAVDADGQIIMVPRGASGNYLGVDDDGYMTTVMKGTYGATLKTLAADDEGYLVAILKDNSDQWGQKISVGLAELAARLGSPVSWDRRGQVVQAITFEDGLSGLATSTSGAGAVCALVASPSKTGGYSCQLTTGTTVNQTAGVTVYGDYSPSERVGFEFTFSIASQPGVLFVIGYVWDGTYKHVVQMRWDKTSGELQMYNSAVGYTSVCDFQLPAVPQLFVSVKMVIDLSEQSWVRLLSRGTEYDISGIESRRVADNTDPYLSFQVLAKDYGGNTSTMYLDRMVITTNEP